MQLEIEYKDPVLQKIIAEIERPIIHSTNDVFHDLMSCIIEQQIHYRSTRKVFAKALTMARLEHLTVENFDVFEENALVKMKLSNRKLETILSFLEYWTNNQLDFHSLPDDEVISALSRIKGIGQQSIDMILLYTLGRPNVFPVGDFHLKKIMRYLYALDPEESLKDQMLAVANHWGNQKSMAVLYLLSYQALQPQH